MKIFIENEDHGKLIKVFPNKSDNDFWILVNKDIYDVFIENLEIKYQSTMDFSGIEDENGFCLVDDNITKETFLNIFNDFVDFVETNI